MIGVEGVMGRVVRIWTGVLLIVDVILTLRVVKLGIEISVLLGRDRMSVDWDRITVFFLKMGWDDLAAFV